MVQVGLPDLDAVPVEALLHPDEVPQLAALTAPRAREDWLLGRLAAKRLVRRCLDLDLPLAGIHIANDDAGAPYFRLPGGDDRAAVFNLSLAHCHGRALAALADTSREGWIGADIERLAPRSPALARRILTPGEQETIAGLVPADRDAFVTRHWCLKEAAMKALGGGIRIGFQEFEVAGAGDGRATIRLSPRAAAWRGLGEGATAAGRYATDADFLLALARIPAMPPQVAPGPRL